MLSERSLKLLNSYVAEEVTFENLWNWLAESEYDDTLAVEERDTLASIRLLAIEVDEGLRGPEELREAIRSALRLESTTLCDFSTRLMVVATAMTNWTSAITETLASTPPRITHVRIEPEGAS